MGINMKKKWLADYLGGQSKALKAIPLEIIAELIERFRNAPAEGRTVFVFGNGGSAANTSHFATDLSKGASAATGKKFRVISLNEHTSLVTAIGNDLAYQDIFVKQLENLAKPGDIALTMSVSGNSPNVVKAVEWAKKNNLFTVAFVGGKGGEIANIADVTIKINSLHYGIVEDCQMVAAHMICYALMEDGKQPHTKTRKRELSFKGA